MIVTGLEEWESLVGNAITFSFSDGGEEYLVESQGVRRVQMLDEKIAVFTEDEFGEGGYLFDSKKPVLVSIDGVKVYWCSKSEGHWDEEGVCSSHYTGEYIYWDERDFSNLPESKEAADHVYRG